MKCGIVRLQEEVEVSQVTEDRDSVKADFREVNDVKDVL